jgi:ribosomal protein L3 glutamine methyltransferase
MHAATATDDNRTLSAWVKRAERSMLEAGLHFGHGTATARDEACWMASHVLKLPPDFEAAAFEQCLDHPSLKALDALLERRIRSRRPLAYLVGAAWFAGLEFEVDEHTLVPRSPLAELVVDGLMPWLDLEQPLRALDVGTGCGCIAVHWPSLEVDAIDISEPALARARSNARRHGVDDRVTFHHSDVFSALDGRRYDLIVSNPPYVPNASMTDLPAEYLHEPDSALRAGNDGLDIVRRLLAGAFDHLRPGGQLLIEVGEAQPQTERLLEGVESLWMEFQHGGEGVVLLDRDACRQWRKRFQESSR